MPRPTPQALRAASWALMNVAVPHEAGDGAPDLLEQQLLAAGVRSAGPGEVGRQRAELARLLEEVATWLAVEARRAGRNA